MRRLLRWRLILPGLLFILTVALVGGWQFTRSKAAARLVSQKLEDRLGTTAEFDRLSVGLTSTSVSGLKIFEQGSEPNAEPFVAVGEVNLGLSVLALSAVTVRRP